MTARVAANEAMRLVLRRLNGHGRNADQDTAGGPIWVAVCPNHGGNTGPGVRLDQDTKGNVAVHPHRRNGEIVCTPEQILGAMAITDDRIRAYSTNGRRGDLGTDTDPFARPARHRSSGPAEDSHEIFERLKTALVDGGYAERRGHPRYKCPACGTPGDGHGLRIQHNPNAVGKRTILLICDTNRCPPEEILEPLGLTLADICAGDDVDDLGAEDDDPHSERQANAQAPQPEPTDAGYEQFWKARPVLQHLHDFARARVAAPWAVLGVALVRATCTVQASVKLPAIVGSRASLNLFLGLVGPSGSGKTVAKAVARDALDFGDRTIEDFPIGTGEGIAATYMRFEKRGQGEPPELTQYRFRALFHADEIDGVKAISARNGATLLPVLRSAYSGETLGNQNADIHRRLPVARHTYRLGFIAGIQPARSAILLDDADSGTPQRFLWMPTIDPDAPDNPPAEPVRKLVEIPPAMRGEFGPLEIEVCQAAVDLIRGTHLARIRGGNGNLLDGHGLLTRLKVAAALGILDRRLTVTDEDWQLAEVVMTVSDHTRARCQTVLTDKTKRANEARARAEGDRQVIVTETIDNAAVRRVARLIGRKLTREWINRAELRRFHVAGRDRQYFDDAIERLYEAGRIDREETDNQGPDGVRYRLAEEKP